MAYQPKSYKKFVATAATATLVASAIVPVASAATFTDVNSNYTEAVNYLVANKIAQGTSETTFGTTASITRGDAAVMIANALELNTSSAPDAGFKDLNTRVAGAVNALFAAKIIGGKSATSFAPDDKITRQEMAKVISLAYELDNAGTNNTFVDVNSNWDTYVDALVKNKVTLGKTPTTFGATQNVTRGEFALFVFRAETLVPATPEVVSVSATNLKDVVVSYNKVVDEASAITLANYTVGAQVLAPGSVKLNADKKSVTITLPSALENNANVRVQVKDVKDLAGTKITAFDKLVYVSDTTSPAVSSATYSFTGNLATVKLSEEIQGTETEREALVKVYDANNLDVTAATVHSPDAKTFEINTTGFTADSTYKVVVIGAKDLAGNYFAGNKVETTFSTKKNDEVKPVVSSLDVRNRQVVRVTFSEAIAPVAGKLADLQLDGGVAIPVSNVAAADQDAAGEAVDVNGDGKTWDIQVSATDLTGAKKVTVKNYTDLEGNLQTAAYDKLVQFVADTTASVVQSSKVVGTKFYVTFDEAVTAKAVLATGDVQIVTPSNVLKDVTPTISVDAVDTTGKTLVFDFGTDVATSGNYKIEVASGVVLDGASPANTKAHTFAAVQFGGAADAGKPTLLMTAGPTPVIDANAVVQSADNKYVDVTFSEKVDSSALVTSNYTVNGQQVFENAIFLGDTNKVRLTLKANAITISGNHLVNVSNVRDLAGNVMAAVTTEEVLKENVTPTLNSVTIYDGDTVELTFSENGLTAVDASDFEIKVAGTVVTPASVGSVTGNKVLVNFSSAIPNVSSKIEVKVLDTRNILDAAGNKLAVSTATVN